MKPHSLLRQVITLICVALTLILFSPPAPAANTWAAAYGIGNQADSAYFTGSGAPLAVVTSVHSNAVYYVTSAYASGNPAVNQVLFKTDTLAGTLTYYQATNTWTIASNAVANTNILWLASTNSGMSTNDILVLRDTDNDSYQMLIVSGNATSSSGLVYTNASGYTAIKTFQTVSNAPAGSKLYKMTAVATFAPLGFAALTNSANLSNVSVVGQWLPLSFGLTANRGITFQGPRGLPTLITLTASNATGGGLVLEGEYKQRR